MTLGSVSLNLILMFVVDDDPMSEHLNNSKAIREILTDVMLLSLLDPEPMLVFLKSALGEAVKVGAKPYSWLLHALRIFADLLVKHVSPD